LSIKVRAALPRIEPIVPKLRHQPFNDPGWLFEPKYDGWRGMVYLTRLTCAQELAVKSPQARE
jgi:ATP-dependent DNA ligase